MGLKVAVIGGGPSAEAEISRISAKEVIAGIAQTHEAEYFELDNHLYNNLEVYAPDVAFPVLHGPHGEDGTIQGFCSTIGLPFVGSDLRASALGMDKHVSKLLFASDDIPVLPSIVLTREQLDDVEHRVTHALGTRLVVKPNDLGSALGVSLLPNGGEIRDALEYAFEYSKSVLIEPFKLGREITVAVLDLNDDCPVALPVIEIQVADDGWYDFESKYTIGKSTHLIPPPKLSTTVLDQVANASIRAHIALGCADLSRSDFIVEDSGEFWLLEVNTIPGMTPTSLYPEAAEAHGINFPQLMSRLVLSGYQRGRR